MSNKTVLRLDDVRKSFGNTQVLRGISFDIHQHEVVALLGAFRFRQIHIDEMRQPA